MEIVYRSLAEIRPYENNPRNNETAVDKVADSIREFGFLVPILLDADNTIITGHTRYKAAQRIGIEAVPCVMADDLTPEQARAFRLVDNKTAEFAEWDFTRLQEELNAIDIELSAFDFYKIDELNELDIADEEFLQDTEIVRTKDRKTVTCPRCGEEIYI